MVEFKHYDGTTYSQILDHCDGTYQTIVTTKQCTIPKDILHDPAYDLPWGSDIYARVTAFNLYGQSETSEDGNGGTIVHQPERPINLVEDYSLRTPTTLGLIWNDGVDNGGLLVLDYRINIA